MSYSNVVTSLMTIVDDTLTGLGYPNVTVTNEFVDDSRQPNELPYVYVYGNAATLSKSSATTLDINREFFIELYLSKESRNDIENRTLDDLVKVASEAIIVAIMRAGRSLRVHGKGTDSVANVDIPRDAGVGRATLNRDAYVGTRIDLNITYTILI